MAWERFQLLLGDFRTWADKAHVAQKHVDELRQFIQLEAAEDMTCRSDFIRGNSGNGISAAMRIMAHSAEFVDSEWTPKSANPSLLKDDGAVRRNSHYGGKNEE